MQYMPLHDTGLNSGTVSQKSDSAGSYTTASSKTAVEPETPCSTAASTPMPPLLSRHSNNPELSDESDDELQDWSLLNNISKKGIKDFEPLLTDDDRHQLSAYDQSKLNKSRNMRFNALAVKRGSIVDLENLKTSTIYINAHDHDDLFMLQPKGKFLETMGMIDNQNVCHFGFEETLYLVERGSCVLKFWDKENEARNKLYQEMPPLSLQAAYSILVTKGDRLDQYIVYSILKRDGYIITRNEEFEGKISEPRNQLLPSPDTLFKNLKMSWWTRLLTKVSSFFKMDFPYKFAFSYFNVLTFLHSKVKQQALPKLDICSVKPTRGKYKISFNVWKPSPSFKKKNPPPPDYQITIFKATQRLPKYSELKSLLERSNSNPDTHKPKPKVKPRRTKSGADTGSENTVAKRVLETSWDYAKGIDISNLKYDPHRITFAIVDNATVNFITLSHCSFVSEGPVWRDHWVTWRPPPKKNRPNGSYNNNRGKFNKNKKNLALQEVSTDSNNGNKTPVPEVNPVMPKSAHF